MSLFRRRHLGVALAVALLGACAGAGALSRASTASGVAAAASTGSSIVWDLPDGEPGSIDPALSGTSSSTTPLANMCEALTTYSASGKLEPWLASSWSQPNPKTLVFNIRPGVKFWDGEPLTAGDVVYSLTRQLNPQLGGTWTDPWFTDVASIKQTGASQGDGALHAAGRGLRRDHVDDRRRDQRGDLRQGEGQDVRLVIGRPHVHRAVRVRQVDTRREHGDEGKRGLLEQGRRSQGGDGHLRLRHRPEHADRTRCSPEASTAATTFRSPRSSS